MAYYYTWKIANFLSITKNCWNSTYLASRLFISFLLLSINITYYLSKKKKKVAYLLILSHVIIWCFVCKTNLLSFFIFSRRIIFAYMIESS